VDGAQFAQCTSPLNLGGLSEGPHEFAVRAVNGGDVDQSPATRRFVVDRTGPAVSVHRVGKARRKIKGKRARVRFTFTASEPVFGYQCAVDGGPFREVEDRVVPRALGIAPCNSPKVLRLRPGRHRLAVRAIDLLGNPGPVTTAKVRVVKRG
jgi:hypothetical protein